MPKTEDWDIDEEMRSLIREKLNHDYSFKNVFRHDLTKQIMENLHKRMFSKHKTDHFIVVIRGCAGVGSGTGTGKCFGKGTRILMFDGSVKKVEDVVVGDLIMGDDSSPRKVISLARGNEMLYDVIPVKGEKYTVNESHILSLKGTNCYHILKEEKKYHEYANKKIDLSLIDYLKSNKTIKHIMKGYKVPLDFPFNDIKIDPYWLGLWIADGDMNGTGICKPDKEVIEFIKEYAVRLDLRFSIGIDKRNQNSNFYKIVTKTPNTENYLLTFLRSYNLIRNKHIPSEYKINSREVRLKLLAGILDGDGYYQSDKEHIEICTVKEVLRDDYLFLIRSLGLAGYWSEKIVKEKVYYRISISGDLSILPMRVARKIPRKRLQKKDVLVTGIKVVPVGIGEYFGFEILGSNSRFLLYDFTVVHNTSMGIELGITFDKTFGNNHIDFTNEGLLKKMEQYAVVGEQKKESPQVFMRDESPDSLRRRSQLEFSIMQEALRDARISLILIKPEAMDLGICHYIFEPLFFNNDFTKLKVCVVNPSTDKYRGFINMTIHKNNPVWVEYMNYKKTFEHNVVNRQVGSFIARDYAVKFMESVFYPNCYRMAKKDSHKIINVKRLKKYLNQFYSNLTNAERDYIIDDIKEIEEKK